MSRRLKWTRRALRRLEAIFDYIAQDSPQSAARVSERIYAITQNLVDFPAIGRVGRISGTRELPLPDLPYIIAYRVTQSSVDILTIIHTSQRWPEEL
jgi:toxin ParE1/3/4